MSLCSLEEVSITNGIARVSSSAFSFLNQKTLRCFLGHLLLRSIQSERPPFILYS